MYFDPHGLVQACCLNLMYPLGNVAGESLRDIWRGPKADALRQAMRDYDLTQGCRQCLWHIEGGSPDSVYALRYDRFADQIEASFNWPRMMEFQITNVCNLECVQCRGEWSSLVRRNRERLPPLPKVYGEQFFSELRPFLPHLAEAHFLGGEPFLAPETLRIWEMILEDGLSVASHATTNATVLDRRVERILDALPVSVVVSLDGCTKTTYETIRRNADFDVVMQNVERFRQYTRQRGTGFSLSHCLMRQNWREFGAFLQLGDRLDCDVWVNLVLDPPECSLYRLPPEELRRVVADLEAQCETVERQLTRNLPVWRRELARLQAALRQESTDSQAYISADLLAPLGTPSRPSPAEWRQQQADGMAELRQWSGGEEVQGLLCDTQDVVQGLADGTRQFLGCPAEAIVGRRIADVFSLLRTQISADLRLTAHWQRHGAAWREVRFGDEVNGTTVQLATWPRWSNDGRPEGSVTFAAHRQGAVAAGKGP